MIIQGEIVDPEITRVYKSINDNLKNKDVFKSDNPDTANTGAVEILPPVPMRECFYIFKESSHVANCCRILASDIIYNTITLTPATENPEEHLVNQVNKINEYLNKSSEELRNLLIDYLYAGWGALEYAWNNTEFKLQQVPIHTCSIIQVKVNNTQVYLLKQQINNSTNFFKIMGEDYPPEFNTYNNQPLGNVALIGGDNIYQFFSLPRWINSRDEILTEIAIKKGDYKTVVNGNIASGVLMINLEPQLAKPVEYDDEGKPVPQKPREEVMNNELKASNGGTAVLYNESNRQTTMDYVKLTNDNQGHLSELKVTAKESVLNDYNVPKTRLMDNTEKESMNSDKTKSIWEIYTINLQDEQKPVKIFISELLYELYSIQIEVNISTPIFSDRRETEIKLHSTAWNDGALTLEQYITALADYLPVINLNDYDFTQNRDVWEYRKIPELTSTLSEDDIAMIEAIEAQLNQT